MGPNASALELALTAIGTVIVGQWLAGKFYGPKKPKLSDLPFDRFGPLPESMIEKLAEEPPPHTFTPEEIAETNRVLREECPWFPDWLISPPPAIPLPPPTPMLLLPRPLKLPLGEDGGQGV
jgi:hypothetical protein